MIPYHEKGSIKELHKYQKERKRLQMETPSKLVIPVYKLQNADQENVLRHMLVLLENNLSDQQKFVQTVNAALGSHHHLFESAFENVLKVVGDSIRIKCYFSTFEKSLSFQKIKTLLTSKNKTEVIKGSSLVLKLLQFGKTKIPHFKPNSNVHLQETCRQMGLTNILITLINDPEFSNKESYRNFIFQVLEEYSNGHWRTLEEFRKTGLTRWLSENYTNNPHVQHILEDYKEYNENPLRS